MRRYTLITPILLQFCLVLSSQDARPTREGQPPNVGQAAEPYVVYDTKPVILHGPFLVAPSETSVSIAWTTDTPSHSKVLYGIGKLDKEAIHQVNGLLPIGTNHSVVLTGLKPGQIYQYRVVSTRVVKMKGYWPDKGLSAESDVSTFTTFDGSRPTSTFYVVTDTHEDTNRINTLMKLADWKSADYLLHLGDAFNTVESE